MITLGSKVLSTFQKGKLTVYLEIQYNAQICISKWIFLGAFCFQEFKSAVQQEKPYTVNTRLKY